MKIAVCMKQVPASSEGNMDEKTGVLIRAGLESVVNVYDLAALEAALQIREETGGEIHVFTMGPGKAEDVLREAFARGADEGYLVCSKEFAGADVLATSYTLSQAIQTAGTYDLILCGRQTTDGDTAQVSGAVAKWLGIPHVNWVTQAAVFQAGDAENEKREVRVEYCMEERNVQAKVSCPCLLSVERSGFIPRMPSLKLKISGRKKEIHLLTLEDLKDNCPKNYGLKGSATRVRKIFPPKRTVKKEVKTLEKTEAAAYVLDALSGYLQEERL